jgi:uncharacterized protein
MLPGPAFRMAVIGLPLLVLIGAAPKPAPVSPHEKAARDLVRLVSGREIAKTGMEAMVKDIRSDPDTAPYEDVFRAWYQKFFAENDAESEMVKLYMETFSEKELLEITAFYKTPAGRKAITALPELMTQAAEVGMRRTEEHRAELMEMLEQARVERGLAPIADEAAQKRTVADIRNTGTAMFSWLTDQVGAAAAGQSQVDMDQYDVLSREELQAVLLPMYLQMVPETDGWGNPYQYYLNVANPMAEQVMGIRSPGRDGRFSADSYTVTSFDPSEFDEDIVWADGFFVRWPQRK